MKNSVDTIGNRTRDLPACSAVPQPTAPPRPPNLHVLSYTCIIKQNLLAQNWQGTCGSRSNVWLCLTDRTELLLVFLGYGGKGFSCRNVMFLSEQQTMMQIQERCKIISNNLYKSVFTCCVCEVWPLPVAARSKGGYTLVTLPRIVTPYRDSVDGTRARVTYQKLVTR